MTDLVAFLRARLDEDEAWGLGPAGEYGHDPARVLREIEAKRRILTMYEETKAEAEDLASRRAHGATVMAGVASLGTLYLVVQEHAAVYSDHPDYQEAWKP